jgi:hypothetical protein
MRLAVPRSELRWGHGDGLVLRGLSELPVILGGLGSCSGSGDVPSTRKGASAAAPHPVEAKSEDHTEALQGRERRPAGPDG